MINGFTAPTLIPVPCIPNGLADVSLKESFYINKLLLGSYFGQTELFDNEYIK